MELNKFTIKIRLENLIKSGQSLHTVCQGEYNTDNKCTMVNYFPNFKCGYKIDEHCTYNKFIRGYN